MPPKSSTKKEQILWYLCEKCQINITSKDREEHEHKYCPQQPAQFPFQCSYIFQQKFYANNLADDPPIDDVPLSIMNNLPMENLNGFIFLSESVMNLCGFILGDWLAVTNVSRGVETDNEETLTPDKLTTVVRSVWPIQNRFNVSTVFVTKDEFEYTWAGEKEVQLIIEKLPIFPAVARKITLESLVEPIDNRIWIDLSRFIGKDYQNRIFNIGQCVRIQFFNKTFEFNVVEIVGENYNDKFDDIEVKMSQLNIDDKKWTDFYLITGKTKFNLASPKKIENPDKLNLTDQPTTNVVKKSTLIGGLTNQMKELQDYLKFAFGHGRLIKGIQISRAILLYGQSGCGKSLICDALIELNATSSTDDVLVIRINASDIFSKYFGESEANLAGFFERAYENYPKQTIIIVEDVSSICNKDTKEDSAKRVSAAFLNALDTLHTKSEGAHTFLLGTTNNIDLVSPAVRRSGRFDVELEIPVPNPNGRIEILKNHLNQIPNNLTQNDCETIANMCHGFVGSDLINLISKAASYNLSNSTTQDDEEIKLKLNDFLCVIGQIKPSAMREVLIECPNIKWTDIGGQQNLKLQLKQAIEWPLTNPEKFIKFGISPPRGILMFGPPGCSKTMIAKALATESKVNFLSIKGPELFSMWVGESERAVRDLFRKARQVAPAIIFFDEIDAIGGERSNGGSSGGSSGSSVKERVLAQMLTEMDGVNTLNNVTIVAATNRPDLIDKALMRPGRIDRIVYVRLPDQQTRQAIFDINFKRMPINENVNINNLVERTEGYSGAEVQAVCQEAALVALQNNFDADTVQEEDFNQALEIVQPRTSQQLLDLYEEYVKKF